MMEKMRINTELEVGKNSRVHTDITGVSAVFSGKEAVFLFMRPTITVVNGKIVIEINYQQFGEVVQK